MPSQKIFASPQDVENAFYEALGRADVDAIMAVWAEDEEIVCIHPGGPRLVGYGLIRESWQHIFSRSSRLTVKVSQQLTLATPFSLVSTVLEQIGTRDDDTLSAPVAATNIYLRGALGWRMVLHHASPVPPGSIDELPKVLH